MARRRNARKAAAARARTGKAQKKNKFNDEAAGESSSSDTGIMGDSDVECTGWTGGVNHVLSDSEDDETWEETHSVTDSLDSAESEIDSDEDLDLEELEGQDLVEGLKKCWELELELQMLTQLTPYELLLEKRTSQEWKNAEAKRGLGYNGLSDRRKREINQKLREKEEQDKVTRER
jgi:hypothetical protein